MINILIRKLFTAIRSPKVVLVRLLYFISPLLSDRRYLLLLFPLKTGYRLNLEHPKTYNEKLQWLKLHYKNPLLPKLVDKYEYKLYVAKILGEDYVVKNLGIWDSVDEIDFLRMPRQFVLKTTHDQGGVVICRDSKDFDVARARRKLKRHLNRNLFYLFREWPYKDVKPRVIAEELLIDARNGDLMDYKFYCFNGEPRIMYISSGRGSSLTCFDFYDMEFNYLDIRRPNYGQAGDVFKKPDNWDNMIELARKISFGLPHVRVDFYNINRGRIFLGEFTLFQGGGFMPFLPKKWDYELGSFLELPRI